MDTELTEVWSWILFGSHRCTVMLHYPDADCSYFSDAVHDRLFVGIAETFLEFVLSFPKIGSK